MMRPMHLLVAAVLVGVGACSALRPAAPLDRDATYRLDRGLAALTAERYREAFDDLEWVRTHCVGRVRGAEAILALAALELDPRNTSGREDIGTDLLAEALRSPSTADWARPLTETTYLLALSLGAAPAEDLAPAGDRAADRDTAAAGAEEPADSAAEPARTAVPAAAVMVTGAERPETASVVTARGCGPAVSPATWAAPRLPTLPGPPLVAQLSAAEAASAEASARADALTGEVARLRQRLEETEAELERIRKTLKP